MDRPPPWHDAETRSARVDRSKPGEVNDVELDVVWPDDAATFIRFRDCYRFECAVNLLDDWDWNCVDVLVDEEMFSHAVVS